MKDEESSKAQICVQGGIFFFIFLILVLAMYNMQMDAPEVTLKGKNLSVILNMKHKKLPRICPYNQSYTLSRTPEVDQYAMGLHLLIEHTVNTSVTHIRKDIIAYYQQHKAIIVKEELTWENNLASGSACRYEVWDLPSANGTSRLHIQEACPVVGGKRGVSRGGACFETLIFNSYYRDNCQVHDQYNGHYLCECVQPPGSFTINIQIMFIDYSAYIVRNIQPLYRTIWNETYDRSDTKVSNYSVLSNTKADVTNKNHAPDGRWKKVLNNTNTKSSWIWETPGGLIVPPKPDMVRTCMKNTDNLIFYGDSHIRFLFNYLLLQRGGKFTDLVRKNVFNFKAFGSWEFTESHFPEDISKCISKDFLTYPNIMADDSSHTVVFTLGAWTLFRKNHYPPFFDNIEKLVNTIKRLRKSLPKVRIIFITSPPMRGNLVYIKGESRNNFNVKMLNYLEMEKLGQSGAEIFDWFKLMITRNYEHDDDKCGIHPFCLRATEKVMVGAIGTDVGNMFIDCLCNKQKESFHHKGLSKKKRKRT